MDYDIKFDDGVFFVKLSGDVKIQAVISYCNDLFGHEEWTKGSRLLADHSELKINWPEHKAYENVEKIVKVMMSYRDKLEGSKIAALYDQNSDASTELGLYDTLFKYLKVPLERKVFNNFNSALKWLNPHINN